LTFGDVLSETNGFLNIKNPACYVFPKENSCAPGDHFKSRQRELAENFVSYKQFSFGKSTPQKIAELITAIALIFVSITLVYFGLEGASRLAKRRAGNQLENLKK
jgi:hypothetical protein